MYALAAHIDTTRVRATGVAAALTISMSGCFVALLVLKTHIDVAPKTSAPSLP